MKEEKDERLDELEHWLSTHRAVKTQDIVFDGTAMITTINKGLLNDYYIELTPLSHGHNLGYGKGKKVIIRF